MRRETGVWLCPDINMYRDKEEKYLVTDIGLPGVKKEDIELETGEAGFCLKAKRDDAFYDSCFHFTDRIVSQRAEASFINGLLKLKIPLSRESMHARKLVIK